MTEEALEWVSHLIEIFIFLLDGVTMSLLACAIFSKVNISFWCSIELGWLLETWQSDKSSLKGEKGAKIC